MSEFDVSVAPTTIGELRRRLEAMGQPWIVPGRYNAGIPIRPIHELPPAEEFGFGLSPR